MKLSLDGVGEEMATNATAVSVEGCQRYRGNTRL